jgi:hypothetical protein
MQARRVSERKGVRGPAADSAAGPHLELGHQAEQGGETSFFFFSISFSKASFQIETEFKSEFKQNHTAKNKYVPA